MIILTLVVANLMFISGSGVPFFLLPKYYENGMEDLGIAASLNKSANPCNNFYEYACGSWIQKTQPPDFHLVWNQWQHVGQKIFKRLEIILESKKPVPKYLLKAQNMYNACIHNQNSELKYINNLKTLINNLNGWPLVTQAWNTSGYNWAIDIAEVIRTFGIYPLLKMHVFIDLQNTSQYALYIEHGEVNLPQTILINPLNYKRYMKMYELWIFETIRYLFPNRIHSRLKLEIKKIIKFECEVAKLLLYKDTSKKISLNELQQMFPLKWDQIFGKLFQSTSISINCNDTVILRSHQYLKNLLLLISNTNAKTVANYIIWSVVKNLSRETTKYMRRLNFMMDNTIFGIKQDITIIQECIGKINTYLDINLIPKYVEHHLHPHTIDAVESMIKNIKSEFIEMLRKTIWIENTTKNLAMEKIASLKFIIAYPKWINNETLLEDKFKELKISNNHFMNIIQLKAFKMKNDFLKLKQPVKFEWPGSVFEVNAYYSILQNAIFVPMGMLEPPFFDITAPTVHNYGALGSLIGHEISHALDVLGRHADKNGNIRNWWTQKDVFKYEEIITCFKQQYDNYNINGMSTLGENIADNVGLQISYKAFQNLKTLKVQTNVKDLKEFSTNQLFFIAFSQVWCEISSDNELLNEEEHAPVEIRVLGTLHNSKEFDKAFYCFKDDKDKCSLW